MPPKKKNDQPQPGPVATTNPPEPRWDPSGLIHSDDPATVRYERARGYQWPSFTRPIDYHYGASSIGAGVDNWDHVTRAVCARTAAQHRGRVAELSEDAAARLLRDLFKQASDSAMAKGRRFHGWTAHIDSGLTPPDPLPAAMDGWGVAWETFKLAYNPEWVAIERTISAPHIDVIGTADRIVKFPEGTELPGLPPCRSTDWYVLDIKTTSQNASRVSPSLSYVMQVTALGQATHIAIEEQTREYPLPALAGGIIVTCTPEGKAVVNTVDVHNPVILAQIIHRARARRLHRETANADMGTAHVLDPHRPVDKPLTEQDGATEGVLFEISEAMFDLSESDPDRAEAAKAWVERTFGLPYWRAPEMSREDAQRVLAALQSAHGDQESKNQEEPDEQDE